MSKIEINGHIFSVPENLDSYTDGSIGFGCDCHPRIDDKRKYLVGCFYMKSRLHEKDVASHMAFPA